MRKLIVSARCKILALSFPDVSSINYSIATVFNRFQGAQRIWKSRSLETIHQTIKTEGKKIEMCSYLIHPSLEDSL